MDRSLGVLDQVRIASPCHESWAEMTGDDRVRYCNRCSLNVYNLSEMTRNDAEELIRNTEGRLCVRYHARADGTIITQNCPVGRGLVRRRLMRIVAGAAAAFGALIGTVHVLGGGSGFRRVAQLRDVKAFAPISNWLSPKPARTLMVMGDMIRPTFVLGKVAMPSGSQSQTGGTVNSTAACDGSGSVDGSDKAVDYSSNVEPAEVER